jgi:PAS domain S-box-containing protein
MSGSGSQLCYLRDPRLAPLATSALPAWLWRADGTRMLWANAVGAMMFGASTPTALRARRFDASDAAAVEIVHLSPTLSTGASPRLQRLHGFGDGIGRALTCACSRIGLSDDDAAILVVAFERAGPELPLGERVARLLAGGEEAIAAFADDGKLIAATASARVRLNGATTLAQCEAQALATTARAGASATGSPGALSIERIGNAPATVLIASFEAPATGWQSPAAEASSVADSPAAAGEGLAPLSRAQMGSGRRRPLRFVWQTDEAGRFTLGASDEFLALVGSRTAAVVGRTWPEVAAELGLDPDGRIARALATRDTWSRLAVSWPIDSGPGRLVVELSGLPVHDRDRAFRGYRGFGVCRDPVRPPNARAEACAGAAAQAIPAPVEKIVNFPGAPSEPTAPALSPLERSAFRELSRKLTQRLNAVVNAPMDKARTAPAGDPHPSGAASAAALAAPLRSLPAAAPGRATASRDVAQAELAALRSMLDTASDAVVSVDPQGTILAANPGAARLFGYGANGLVHHALSELLAPESVHDAYAWLRSGISPSSGGPPRAGREVVGRSRHGGLLQLFMTVGQIGGSPERLCVAFCDISRWKTAQEELTRAKRHAEKASSAKSDFLAGISHEIRTPLNAIIGFSEVMLEERFGTIDNQRYREYLKDIHASGAHLLSLINDLLDLSKIEAGKLELTFDGISLNDLTQQCVAIMQPQASRERVIIRTALRPTLPQVVADARSVRQILLNILSNSIKFTAAGGQVIVSTAISDNGEVALRVRDTGIGMSDKDVMAALEPFRQLATSLHVASDGTGLGLPLTKALAQANHASFCIKSAPKVGTLVEIAFPASRVLAG